MPAPNPAFWRGRKVFLTGHTGFKGSWAALWLGELGATVTGFALAPETDDNLFGLARVAEGMESRISDLGDKAVLERAIRACAPRHRLAHGGSGAGAPVLPRSRRDLGDEPVGHPECAGRGPRPRQTANRPGGDVRQGLSQRRERPRVSRGRRAWRARSLFRLQGPAAEILVSSWRASFGEAGGRRLATARSGNVIGGGDFSEDRLVPDTWRAIRNGRAPAIRNPDTTRPWQHVLDCLNGYFLYTEALATGRPGSRRR